MKDRAASPEAVEEGCQGKQQEGNEEKHDSILQRPLKLLPEFGIWEKNSIESVTRGRNEVVSGGETEHFLRARGDSDLHTKMAWSCSESVSTSQARCSLQESTRGRLQENSEKKRTRETRTEGSGIVLYYVCFVLSARASGSRISLPSPLPLPFLSVLEHWYALF